MYIIPSNMTFTLKGQMDINNGRPDVILYYKLKALAIEYGLELEALDGWEDARESQGRPRNLFDY